MADETATTAAPTAEDANAVTTAAAEAAQGEATPAKAKASAQKAAQETAEKRGFSKEDARMFAEAVVDVLREAGAFDAPPDAVVAPAAPDTIAPAPDEAVPAGAGPAAAPDTGKRTFAQRFMGV